MNTSKTLFIATLGQTDLQLIISDDNGTPFRVEIEKRDMRAIHTLLLNNLSALHFWNDFSKGFPERIPDNRTIEITDNLLQIGDKFIDLEKETVSIYPVLLAEGLEKIKKRDKKYPTSILLLSTNRDKGKNEPFAAGELLAHWIAAHTKQKNIGSICTKNKMLSNGEVGYYNYLSGDDHLPQGVSHKGNVLLSRTIERCFSALAQRDSYNTLYLSTVGGMPLVNEVVRAAAEYYFRQSNILYVSRDQETKNTDISSQNTLPLPRQIEAKKHAETLLMQRDFHGAFAMVSIWYSKESDHPSWLKKIFMLKQFFSGSRLKTQTTDVALKKLSNISPPSYLALLIESALRQEDVYRATALSSVFMDAVLMHFIKRVNGWELNRQKRQITIKNVQEIPAVLTEKRKGKFISKKESDRFSCLLKTKKSAVFSYFTNGGDVPIWIKGLTELLPDATDALKSFEKLFYTIYENRDNDFKQKTGFPSPYAIRNHYNHQGILNMDMKIKTTVKQYMDQEGVWKSISTFPFLDAPICLPILSYTDQESPKQLYKEIISNLIKEMRTPS